MSRKQVNNKPVNTVSFIAGQAKQLMADVGARAEITHLGEFDSEHPALAWAKSGAMWLSGKQQPIFCSAPLAACARAVWLALHSVAACRMENVGSNFDASQLLSERAAFMGLQRQGNISPGRACRFLSAKNGAWLAINMARESDWQQLPALLEMEFEAGGEERDNWRKLERAVADRDLDELLERGRLLGLAIVPASGVSLPGEGWLERSRPGEQVIVQPGVKRQLPIVLDLSSLWAGPLCSHLLQQLGARVIKVESLSRPDGARQGNQAFYDTLNGSKQSVALDFTTDEGIDQLRQLISKADIVIEASRPRALLQLGIDAEQVLAENPGLSWLSITGYGRQSPVCDWVAFGDDAAVAAGLSAALFKQYGQWMFCGDAIADPLTGLHAALAAWVSWLNGGGQLLDVSLYGVVSSCLNAGAIETNFALEEISGDFFFEFNGQSHCVIRPQKKTVTISAAEMGIDTQSILTEFAIPC